MRVTLRLIINKYIMKLHTHHYRRGHTILNIIYLTLLIYILFPFVTSFFISQTSHIVIMNESPNSLTAYWTTNTINFHSTSILIRKSVFEPVITKPHHWRRLFITFDIVNFLLFKNENSTYLMK